MFTKKKLEVFIDYVCPYCMLIEPVIETLQETYGVDVVLRPFELRPYPVSTLKPEDDYLPRVWNQSVYPMASRVGIPIKLPTISPQPRTEKAFLLLQLAQEKGVGGRFSQEVFRAFFQDDRDIGRDEVLLDLATSVGIGKSEAQTVLNDPDRQQKHREEQRAYVNDLAISSVPSFRFGEKVISGVLGLDQLIDLIGVEGGLDGKG